MPKLLFNVGVYILPKCTGGEAPKMDAINYVAFLQDAGMPKRRRTNSLERDPPPVRQASFGQNARAAQAPRQPVVIQQIPNAVLPPRINPDGTPIDEESPWNNPDNDRTAMQRGTGLPYRPNYAGADYELVFEALVREAPSHHYPPLDMPAYRRGIHENGIILGREDLYECHFCLMDDHWPAECHLADTAEKRRRLTEARGRCILCRRTHTPDEPHISPKGKDERCRSSNNQCRGDRPHHDMYCLKSKKNAEAHRRRAEADRYNRNRRPQ